MLFSVFAFTLCISCSAVDQEALQHELLSHQTNDLVFFGEQWRQKPIEERVSVAPIEIVDFLKIDNQLIGLDEVPSVTNIEPSFVHAVRESISLLPDTVKEEVEDHLMSIYLVSNLGSSGYSKVIAASSSTKAGYIVIDQDKLTANPNDWATNRLNSAFKSEVTVDRRLQMFIDDENKEDGLAGIQFILLHEIGHVIGECKSIMVLENEIAMEELFSHISWVSPNKSKYDSMFTDRSKIKFYSIPSMRSPYAEEVFKTLTISTSFPSLYSVLNPSEDFAESFAIYVHSVILGRPYRVEFKDNGQIKVLLDSPFEHDRLEMKKRLLDKYFGGEWNSGKRPMSDQR